MGSLRRTITQEDINNPPLMVKTPSPMVPTPVDLFRVAVSDPQALLCFLLKSPHTAEDAHTGIDDANRGVGTAVGVAAAGAAAYGLYSHHQNGKLAYGAAHAAVGAQGASDPQYILQELQRAVQDQVS